MSFSLPLEGTFAREACGDMSTLVDILNPVNIDKLLGFREALSNVRKNFPVGAECVYIVCIRANDERWLISVGPRGGWKRIWNFGNGKSNFK